MVVITYKSGLRLNQHPFAEVNTAVASLNVSSSGIKIYSGNNEIILDQKRLDRIQERRQLEAAIFAWVTLRSLPWLKIRYFRLGLTYRSGET